MNGRREVRSPRSSHIRGIVSLALLATASCGSNVEGSRKPVEVRDSAGIHLVENLPLDSPRTGKWTLDPRPVVEIGVDEDDSTQHLVRVREVHRLRSGQIVVLDEGRSRLLAFDSSGRAIGAIGRRGEGPGEFSRIRGLYRCGGDSLVVNEVHRLSLFDPQIRFIRTIQLTPRGTDGALRAIGMGFDCSTIFMQSGFNVMPPPGKAGLMQATFFWSNVTGEERDTLGTFGLREVMRKRISGMDQPLSVPWGQEAKWVVGDQRVYFALSSAPEVRAFDGSGRLVEIVRWSTSRSEVTAEDRGLYALKREKWLAKYPQLNDIILDLDAFEKIPATKPAIAGLLLDDEHNLWVRTYPTWLAGRPDLYDFDASLSDTEAADSTPDLWMVLDRSGHFVGTVEVPYGFNLRAISGSVVVGVRKDDSGKEIVAVYRLRKGRTHP